MRQEKIINYYKAIFITCILFILTITACTDKNTIINDKRSLNDFKWYYTDKISFTANITDIDSKYQTNIYFRHTNDYKYSNLFFIVTIISPSEKKQIYRCEYPLASKEGIWYGSNANNLYTISFPIEQLSRFNEPGTWKFMIEQNMRDDILTGITDVGILIKKLNK